MYRNLILTHICLRSSRSLQMPNSTPLRLVVCNWPRSTYVPQLHVYYLINIMIMNIVDKLKIVNGFFPYQFSRYWRRGSILWRRTARRLARSPPWQLSSEARLPPHVHRRSRSRNSHSQTLASSVWGRSRLRGRRNEWDSMRTRIEQREWMLTFPMILASLLFMCLRYIETKCVPSTTTGPQHLPRQYYPTVLIHYRVIHVNQTKDSDHDHLHRIAPTSMTHELQPGLILVH